MIWHLKWYLTPRVISFHRQVSQSEVKTSGGKYVFSAHAFNTLTSVKDAVGKKYGVSVGNKMASVTQSVRVAVDNFTEANKTLSKVQAAINKVSSQRSALGGYKVTDRC